jgi:hypothetical protein
MEIQLFQYHPVIGYTFIPNLKTRIEHESGGYLVRTNAAEFRSEREFEVSKPAGKSRVLLFGDSFTAGDAVSNKYRFGDVLETLVPDIEVYNFALPGTGTDQHYLVWREIARQYEHDLVLIAAQVENIRRVAARHRQSVTSSGEEVLMAKPYFEFEAGGNLRLEGVPIAKEPVKADELSETEREFVDQGGRMPMLRSIVNKMGGPVKDIAQRVTGYQPLPEYNDPEGREWRLMKAILKMWVSEIERPTVIFPIPLYHYIEETASPEAYRTRFAELCGLPGVTVHDPFEEYLALPKEVRRGFRFQKDIHPTPSHHRFLAESLARVAAPLAAGASEGAASR